MGVLCLLFLLLLPRPIQDDWIGRVEFKGWYFVEGYENGPPLNRYGTGGGVLSEAAAAQGVTGSPYHEDDWYELLDKRGRQIKNKEYKKEARISLSWRIDRNHDPVQNIERMIQQLYERKTEVYDEMRIGKIALEMLRKLCVKKDLNVGAVVSKLDADGSGSVDQEELASGLKHLELETELEIKHVEGIFAVFAHLGKLNEQGQIRVNDLAVAISVSDEFALSKALKRHTRINQSLDIHTLAARETPAFHHSKTHSYATRGCMCENQWICSQCGHWHRHGKRVWNPVTNDFLEDLFCKACQQPRPDPLPKVPCPLLVQEYYRITGHKPKVP